MFDEWCQVDRRQVAHIKGFGDSVGSHYDEA